MPGKKGIVILAAGSSSRLGEPKQLLTYRDKNLLNHTIAEAKKAGDGMVVVILGGNFHLIAGNTVHAGVKVIYNPGWEEGISSSIRMGFKEMLKTEPDLEEIILTVCDQPFIAAGQFQALRAEAKISGKDIVASTYSGTTGTPLLVSQIHFPALMKLSGNQGVKTLLLEHGSKLSTVPFEKGEIDIDTPEDYAKLIAG